MITPEQLAKPGTEDAHQMALFCWVAQELHAGRSPELRWLHHVPNGGERDRITAGKMKAAGVRAGVWDLFLPVRKKLWAGCYIEMKKPGRQREKWGGLSDEQYEFQQFAAWQGYSMGICYTWLEARARLLWYLALPA